MLNFVLAAVLCTPVSKPFVGTLCTPNDGKRHAAMMLLGGSEGGDSFSEAAKTFAEHGYVTASVAYFGAKGLPDTLVEIPVETAGKALTALQARSDVDASRIGVLGVSKGGEFSLLVASTYPQIKAVVAIVPSPVAFFGLGVNDVPTGCSWSRDGKALPCVPVDQNAGAAIGEAFMAHQPIVLRPLYDASLADQPSVTKAAFFPLERIRGPVLCLAGADDRMWDSPKQCAMTMSYLRAHRHAYADRQIVYPDAGHLFLTATHGPSSAVTQISSGGAMMEFGGTADGDAAAGASSWKTIWAFLATALK
jgi:dienelactone hydrolase